MKNSHPTGLLGSPRPQGVEVVQVNLHAGDPEAALLAACGPRTRLMAISAVQYASGLRLNLPRLGHGYQTRGVLLCVDAIQQLGALPFDVRPANARSPWPMGTNGCSGRKGSRCSIAAATCVAQLKLHEYGWHMLEHAGDYQRHEWEPARSARRFECGSPNMLGAMALEASLSLLEDVGMAQVEQACRSACNG